MGVSFGKWWRRKACVKCSAQSQPERAGVEAHDRQDQQRQASRNPCRLRRGARAEPGKRARVRRAESPPRRDRHDAEIGARLQSGSEHVDSHSAGQSGSARTRWNRTALASRSGGRRTKKKPRAIRRWGEAAVSIRAAGKARDHCNNRRPAASFAIGMGQRKKRASIPFSALDTRCC